MRVIPWLRSKVRVRIRMMLYRLCSLKISKCQLMQGDSSSRQNKVQMWSESKRVTLGIFLIAKISILAQTQELWQLSGGEMTLRSRNGLKLPNLINCLIKRSNLMKPLNLRGKQTYRKCSSTRNSNRKRTSIKRRENSRIEKRERLARWP